MRKFLAVLLGIAVFSFLISRALVLDSAVNGSHLQRLHVEVDRP
jgi:hypothetical protein